MFSGVDGHVRGRVCGAGQAVTATALIERHDLKHVVVERLVRLARPPPPGPPWTISTVRPAGLPRISQYIWLSSRHRACRGFVDRGEPPPSSPSREATLSERRAAVG